MPVPGCWVKHPDSSVNRAIGSDCGRGWIQCEEETNVGILRPVEQPGRHAVMLHEEEIGPVIADEPGEIRDAPLLEASQDIDLQLDELVGRASARMAV